MVKGACYRYSKVRTWTCAWHTLIGDKNMKHAYLVFSILQISSQWLCHWCKQHIENLLCFHFFSVKISHFSKLLCSRKQWIELGEKENFLVHSKNIQNAAFEKRDYEHLHTNRKKMQKIFNVMSTIFSIIGTVILKISAE